MGEATKSVQEASKTALEMSKTATGVSKNTFDDLTYVGKSTFGDLTKSAKEVAAKKGLLKVQTKKIQDFRDSHFNIKDLSKTFVHIIAIYLYLGPRRIATVASTWAIVSQYDATTEGFDQQSAGRVRHAERCRARFFQQY